MKPLVVVLSFLAMAQHGLLAQALWTRLYPSQSPQRRAFHGLAFDASRGHAVLFGGENANVGLLGDTWTWNGTDWNRLNVGGPSARTSHNLVFDARRERIVMFGGIDQTGSYLQETWEWDGTGWLQRTPVTSPPGRTNAAMVFDEAREVVLLFAGASQGGGILGDLWQWDGQDWLQFPAGVGPSGRVATAMAFDPNSHRVVLYGGQIPNVVFDDMWAWDGATWQRLLPATPPYARYSHSMVTDSRRSRVLLWGGYPHDPTVWEWDGSGWSQHFIAAPTPRERPGLVYDTIRREVLMFGGSSSNYQFDDTWVYRTAHPADFVGYGQGCPGSLGTPELANLSGSLPWLGDVFRTQANAVPAGSGAVFVTGLNATAAQDLGPYGLPGCESFVTLDDLLFAAETAGVATRAIAVPYCTALAGLRLYLQALVLDPGATGGAAVSNAGEVVVGIR